MVFFLQISRGFNGRTDCCSSSLGFSMSLACLMLLTIRASVNLLGPACNGEP